MVQEVPPMATLVDWSHLDARLRALKAEHGYELDTQALTHLVLEHDLGLTPEDISDANTDGGDDRGIDAVYLDEQEGGTTVHLYQVKHTPKFEKASNNFPSEEIDKVLGYIRDLLNKTLDRATTNALLWSKSEEIWNAYAVGVPSLVVHFCSNMGPLTPAHRQRLLDALKPYHINFAEHTLSTITSGIIEKKHPRIDHALSLVDLNYFERSDGYIRGLIATIEAEQMIRLIRDPDNEESVRHGIFDDNVRIYLTTKNPINSRIMESALSDRNAEFWYLNNGITMTCDTLQYTPGVRGPVVELTNVQIVNGGQTSNALFEAYRVDRDKVKRVLILVRIYETRSREISQLIAETTNSQTPIRTRDLRANDEVQKKLEDAFVSLGYFYERKANQHQGKPREKRIDALVAGQSYVAYHLDKPEVGKKEKRRIFDDLYNDVFNADITPQKLLTPFLIHAEVDRRKRALQAAIRGRSEYEADHLILIDGVYHVINGVRFILEVTGRSEDDHVAGMGEIDNAIRAVAKAASVAAAGDAAYSHSRFFKDRKSTKKIHDAVKEQCGV
jgi:hypothetical protein